MRRHWIGLGLSGVLGLASLACEPGEDDPAVESEFTYETESEEAALEATFVGEASDGNTFVAVVRSGNSFMAYACDNDRGNWFRGVALTTPLILENDAGDQIALALEGDRVLGGLERADGDEGVTFELTRTDADVLFRGESALAGKPLIGGWIVLPDGRQRGFPKTFSHVW